MNYGFYHYSWVAGPDFAARLASQRAAITRTARQGATLLALSHLGNLRETRRLLTVAAGLGVTLIVEDLEGVDLGAVEAEPNLVHSVRDDAEVPRRGEALPPLETFRAQCAASRTARRCASIGPTLEDSRPAFYGPSEAVIVQSYPYSPGESLWAAWLVWGAARANADRAGTVVYGADQLHPLEIGMDRPTPAQIAAQVWVAAACGLDGLLGYTLVDQRGPLPPELERAFTDACQAVNRLTAGRPVSASTTGDLLTATWRGGVSATVDLLAGAVVSVRTRGAA